jgi:serine-type D-Ala-D-Ala carboxypeptidase (penicillin-binding protein 5/6)
VLNTEQRVVPVVRRLLVLLLCLTSACDTASSAGTTAPPAAIATSPGTDVSTTDSGTSATTTVAPTTTAPAATAPATPPVATTPPATTPPATTPPQTAATTAPAPTASAVAPPVVDATAYAVYDATNERWLAERDADAPRPVGSVMKLLTAYVVMQAGEPDRVVTVPAMSLDPQESAIGVYPGERLRRDTLLRAMLIVSANDAARALAVDIAGSEDAFAGLMNEAAASLGLTGTSAANAVGLDDPDGHSTARDMVVLSSILMHDPTFRETVARPDARLHGLTFPATNDLLSAYGGATGVKSGHTTQAGWCLVGSAERDGRSVIVVVLGASSDAARLASTAALLDWAFAVQP